MHLELKHLRTLRELRDAGSLVSAARRLHLTQSALSHQLKALEDQLALPLFVRKSRPLRFTEAGRRLLATADEILPRLQHVENELKRLAEGSAGRLHIAIECHSCFEWLLPSLDAYRRDWPDVEVDLTQAFPFEPLPALLRGDIDLVITSDPQERPDVHYTPLFTYQALLAMASKHRLAVRSYIVPADLAGETLITYPVERERLDIFRYFLNPAGIAPAGVRTTELTALMLQLVASRRGVCALPNWALAEYLARDYVTARPLDKDGLRATLYAAVCRGEQDQPHIATFLATARATCFATLSGIEPPVSRAAEASL